MIDSEIKKLIDDKCKDDLIIILSDALSQDPTLDTYKEELEYLNSAYPEFWDEHSELTPFEGVEINEDLFYEIKSDLRENFSKKRFKYAIEIAVKVFADRIRTAEPEPAPAPAPKPAAAPKSEPVRRAEPAPQFNSRPESVRQSAPQQNYSDNYNNTQPPQGSKKNSLPMGACLLMGVIVLIAALVLLKLLNVI